jgi:hypothetical protein
MGHTDQEIEKLLQHQVIASKMRGKRESFVRLFHERGYDEQTLAARFLSERVREKSLRTDGVELPLQAERLTYFSKRISEMSNGVELSISEPLTEDEALGLVNAYAFSDLRSGSGERFALRLARLLKGMSYDTVAELESIDTDETVKSGAVQVFLSANAPKFAAKYLSSLESTSAAEPISTIVSEQTHEPHTEPYQIETPQTESEDTSTVDEAPVTEEINPVEQSAPERFDLETAQIRILELQTDGEKRHADGSLDAQDIESIYGVKAKRVRAMAHDIIFQLSSQGKHIKCPGRKRQYGQITEHYNHVILDVLLPEVAKLSLQPDETL